MLSAKIYFQNPGKRGIVPEFRINRVKYVWHGYSGSKQPPVKRVALICRQRRQIIRRRHVSESLGSEPRAKHAVCRTINRRNAGRSLSGFYLLLLNTAFLSLPRRDVIERPREGNSQRTGHKHSIPILGSNLDL